MKVTIFLTIYLSYQQVFAGDFTSIQINGWKKEELAHDHLRFSNSDKKDYSLHLQVDSYNNENIWNEYTLLEDIKRMVSMRKTMSSFLGLKNYQIQTFKFENKILEVSGSYSRYNKKITYFKEINFYRHKNFLQLKIISEETPPTDLEIEKIIKEINPTQVDID